MDRTPYGAALRDTVRRRQVVYEAMMTSSDPIARELGQQLRNGNMAPRDLLTLPEYREFFAQGFTAAARLDLEELAGAARTVTTDRLTGDLQRDASQAKTVPDRGENQQVHGPEDPQERSDGRR
jgi:hypothetical protein